MTGVRFWLWHGHKCNVAAVFPFAFIAPLRESQSRRISRQDAKDAKMELKSERLMVYFRSLVVPSESPWTPLADLHSLGATGRQRTPSMGVPLSVLIFGRSDHPICHQGAIARFLLLSVSSVCFCSKPRSAWKGSVNGIVTC